VVSMSGEKPSNSRRTSAAAKMIQRKFRYVITEQIRVEKRHLSEATIFRGTSRI